MAKALAYHIVNIKDQDVIGGVRPVDIFTATKEELERARIDMNDAAITQSFAIDDTTRNDRADMQAAIMNRLQQLTFAS